MDFEGFGGRSPIGNKRLIQLAGSSAFRGGIAPSTVSKKGLQLLLETFHFPGESFCAILEGSKSFEERLLVL